MSSESLKTSAMESSQEEVEHPVDAELLESMCQFRHVLAKRTSEKALADEYLLQRAGVK